MSAVLPDTLRLLLEGIGRSDETEFYLRKFQSDKSACFAILVPDCSVLEEAPELLATHLQFLLRLGLHPAVLFSGPRGDWMRERLLEQAGLEEMALVTEVGDPAADGGAELVRRAAGARSEGRLLCLHAREALLPALETLCRILSRRLLFLRMQGMLLDRHGQPISLYKIRRNEPPLGGGGHGLRSLALALYDAEACSHLAVASPQLMLKEIFTVKGAGTILRPGSRILRLLDSKEVDDGRLRQLLQQSFGRVPGPKPLFVPGGEVYLEEGYRAAIILEPHPAGFYLSKFSVDVQARGEGTALELWEAVIRDHPRLFWRSRLVNPIARWYNKLADGRHRVGEWYVFWRGVESAHIPEMITFCLGRGDDFV